MKKLIVFLLASFIFISGCQSSSSHKMKSPKKAHYKTREGKQKQKRFNNQYKGT
jgi:uncharacterized protein YceK